MNSGLFFAIYFVVLFVGPFLLSVFVLSWSLFVGSALGCSILSFIFIFGDPCVDPFV